MPRQAKLLSLILLTPLFVALLARYYSPADEFLRSFFGTSGRRLLINYTTILLCFMSGSLWGFASQNQSNDKIPYLLSIIPIFFMLSAYSFWGGFRIYFLFVGFVLLLIVDLFIAKKELTPNWWLRCKIPFTLAVLIILCLIQFSHFILATLALT